MMKAQGKLPKPCLADCGVLLYESNEDAAKAVEILNEYGFTANLGGEVEMPEESAEAAQEVKGGQCDE